MWFVPASAMTEEQRSTLPTQVAIRTPNCLLRVAQALFRSIPTPPDPLEAIIQTTSSRTNVSLLGDAFKAFGTDKSTTHNYHILYGYVLTQLHQPVRLLEIGLGSNDTRIPSNMGPKSTPGASIRAFRSVFPELILYGADIDPTIKIEGIDIFTIDQTEPESFDRVIEGAGTGFDLIIDDGLHSPDANLNTLFFALHNLNPRGYFVIEDIPEAALPIWYSVQLMCLATNRFTATILRARQSYVFVVTGNFTSIPIKGTRNV